MPKVPSPYQPTISLICNPLIRRMMKQLVAALLVLFPPGRIVGFPRRSIIEIIGRNGIRFELPRRIQEVDNVSIVRLKSKLIVLLRKSLVHFSA